MRLHDETISPDSTTTPAHPIHHTANMGALLSLPFLAMPAMGTVRITTFTATAPC